MTAGDPTQPAHPRADPTRVYTGPGPGGGGAGAGGEGGSPVGGGGGEWGGGWSQSQKWLIGIICAVIAITAFVLVIFVFSDDNSGNDTPPTTVSTQPSSVTEPSTTGTTGQSTTQAPVTTSPTTTPPSTGIVITLLPPTS